MTSLSELCVDFFMELFSFLWSQVVLFIVVFFVVLSIIFSNSNVQTGRKGEAHCTGISLFFNQRERCFPEEFKQVPLMSH